MERVLSENLQDRHRRHAAFLRGWLPVSFFLFPAARFPLFSFHKRTKHASNHGSLVQKLSARTRPHHGSLVQRELSAQLTEGLSPQSLIYLIKNRPSYPLRLALLDTSPFQKGRHGERRPSPACLPFIKKQIGHPTNRFNSVHFSFSPIDKRQKVCYIVDRNYTFTRKLTDKGENL